MALNDQQHQTIKEALKRRIREGVCNRLSSRIFEAEGYEMAPNDTHFAIYKPQNKIVFSWDYHDIDPVDLRNSREDYFTCDIRDNDLDPKDIKVVGRNMCVKMGLDPSNPENWTNGPSDNRWNGQQAEPTNGMPAECNGGVC